MRDTIEKRIFELETTVRHLQDLLRSELARVEKMITECENPTIGYMADHSAEHKDLTKMIFGSYAKTHPGYFITLNEIDDIIGKGSLNGGDPQPCHVKNKDESVLNRP